MKRIIYIACILGLASHGAAHAANFTLMTSDNYVTQTVDGGKNVSLLVSVEADKCTATASPTSSSGLNYNCNAVCVFNNSGALTLKETNPQILTLGTFGSVVATQTRYMDSWPTNQCTAAQLGIGKQTFRLDGVVRPTGSHTLVANVNAANSNTINLTWRISNSTTSSATVTQIQPASSGIFRFSATVTGYAPTGHVDFKAGTTVLASQQVSTGGNGTTLFQAQVQLKPGSYDVIAVYSGDGNNTASQSGAPFKLKVGLAPSRSAAAMAAINLLLND